MINRRKSKSVKKTLGVIGTINAYTLATVQALRINTEAAMDTALMWIVILTAALLALKLGTGIVDAVANSKQAKSNGGP